MQRISDLDHARELYASLLRRCDNLTKENERLREALRWIETQSGEAAIYRKAYAALKKD
jgi:hypothetical protein